MTLGQQPIPTAGRQAVTDVYIVSPTGKRLRVGGSKAMALFRAFERFIGQPEMAGEIIIAVNNGGVAAVTGKEAYK